MATTTRLSDRQRRKAFTFDERQTAKPFQVIITPDGLLPGVTLTIRLTTVDPETGQTRGLVSTHDLGSPPSKSGVFGAGLMAPPPGLRTTIEYELSEPAEVAVDLVEYDWPATRPKADHHSIAFDESDYAETSTSTTSLAVTNVTHDSGDLLVALGTVFNGSFDQTITVSGSINGSYTKPTESPHGNGLDYQLHGHYFQNAAGGTETVTFTPGGAGNKDIDAVIAEISGAKTSGVLDKWVEDTNDEGSGGAAYNVSLATSTLAQANNIIIANLTHNGLTRTLAVTTTNGVQIAEDEDNATSQAFNAQYVLTTSTTGPAMTWSVGSAASGGRIWYAMAMVFQESSATIVSGAAEAAGVGTATGTSPEGAPATNLFYRRRR